MIRKYFDDDLINEANLKDFYYPLEAGKSLGTRSCYLDNFEDFKVNLYVYSISRTMRGENWQEARRGIAAPFFGELQSMDNLEYLFYSSMSKEIPEPVERKDSAELTGKKERFSFSQIERLAEMDFDEVFKNLGVDLDLDNWEKMSGKILKLITKKIHISENNLALFLFLKNMWLEKRSRRVLR